MSRRHVASKREILPDPKYGDRTVAKFINMVMSRGKKAVAEKIVYGALSEVEHRGKGQAIDVFKQALEFAVRQIHPVERLEFFAKVAL
jgi:small subunit ribosomal protein S7